MLKSNNQDGLLLHLQQFHLLNQGNGANAGRRGEASPMGSD